MLYVVAILLPPLAILLCGKPRQALLNLLLTFAGYIPGLIHALILTRRRQEELRMSSTIDALLPDKPRQMPRDMAQDIERKTSRAS